MLEKYSQIETVFGLVTVLEHKNGKMMVQIDQEIKATFDEEEFFKLFLMSLACR